MQYHRQSGAGSFHLSVAEWMLPVMAMSAFGIAAVALGKDTGWDFRNYHWYDPYALLDGRLGFDVAVAHQATYFNPLLHVPFYLLATFGTSWLAVFYAGAVQGANVLPLYLISRSALAQTVPQATAGILTLVAMAGSTILSMIGKTSYDQSVLSFLILAGLAIVVVRRDQLVSPTGATAATTALAGLAIGLAVGLKLTEAPYAFGYAATLVVLRGSNSARMLRLVCGGAGGLAGVLAAGGFWFYTLERATGNPLFPFFNDLVHSSLIAPGSYRDERFIPDGLSEYLFFPFRFLLDYRVTDDAPFRDLRIPLMYCLLPVVGVLCAMGKEARDPPARPGATLMLFTFVAASYLAWLHEFAVYRYLVLLEMLAPLTVFAAVGYLPVSMRARWSVLGLLLAITLAAGRYDPGQHSPLGDPYVQVRGLSFPHPTETLILMTGEQPLAYLIPSLPAVIPVLRIDGLVAGPFDGSSLTAAMRARVRDHRGDLFLIAAMDEDAAAQTAVAAYDLRIIGPSCRLFESNLGGRYRLCPLARLEHEPG